MSTSLPILPPRQSSLQASTRPQSQAAPPSIVQIHTRSQNLSHPNSQYTNTTSLPQYTSANTFPIGRLDRTSTSTIMTTPNQAPGLRYPSNKKTIYDRNLNRSKNAELSRAAFAYLFVEMISYAQKRVKGIADLEKRLNQQGYPLGLRLLDLLLSRSSNPLSSIRPTRILPLLQFIAQTLWRHLFARPADALERSESSAGQYMLFDNEPLVNSYISLPKEMSQLNCAAFVAGIIEGVCDGAGFATESVTAHSVGEQEGEAAVAAQASMWPGKTVFLIQFKPEVLEREEILGRGGG